MSATNRGAVRNEHDFYPTPEWCTHRLLDRLALPARPEWWLEPCVGDGAILRAVNSHRGGRPVTWTTADIRPETNAAWIGDFTDVRGFGAWLSKRDYQPERFDVCVTNPPFALALAFAAHAIEICDVVAFLLRLNWLRGTDEHNAWVREHMPSVYVLPQRPSFDGRGTDATEYAWMVWGMDAVPKIAMLDDTPDEVRASHNLEMRRRDRVVRDLFDPPVKGGLFG